MQPIITLGARWVAFFIQDLYKINSELYELIHHYIYHLYIPVIPLDSVLHLKLSCSLS